MLTLAECLDDESEAEESEKDAIEFLEPAEDASVTFEPSKQSFDLIPFAIQGAVVAPRINTIGFAWHNQHHAQFQHQLTSLSRSIVSPRPAITSSPIFR